MTKFLNILTNSLISKTAPIVIGTVLVSSPSLAASFASSEANVTIDNFSENPYQVGVDTNSEIFLSEYESEVYADAFATAIFEGTPGVEAFAHNSSKSQAGGAGNNFFALGQSGARVIGDFLIEAEEELSFDFFVDFALETSIDNISDEIANAEGGVSFYIFDTTDEDTPILLDFFGVSGNLSTPGNNDFFGSSENIIASNFTIDEEESWVNQSFGGNEESVLAFFDGSYLRTFEGDQTRNIRLVEVKGNYAQVKSTPEPSTTIAFVLFSALGVATGLKSKRNRV